MQRIDTSFELWWFIAAEYFFYSRVTSENTSTGNCACKQSGKKLSNLICGEKSFIALQDVGSILPPQLEKADSDGVNQSDFFITCE